MQEIEKRLNQVEKRIDLVEQRDQFQKEESSDIKSRLNSIENKLQSLIEKVSENAGSSAMKAKVMNWIYMISTFLIGFILNDYVLSYLRKLSGK